jgi:CRISPR-associated protein Csb2
VRYSRETQSAGRPCIAFKLVDENDDTFSFPHARLVHLAGMVRHLAIEAMKRHAPAGVGDSERWVDQYVAGHQQDAGVDARIRHLQLSYVPLPSVGHTHTDPGVRRVLITAPVGDDQLLEHLARLLDGLQLVPERPGQLRAPVFLSRVRGDRVVDHYTSPSRSWASFTPVILPGHDDRKPEKTEELVRKALVQSGIDQPCEFEWSPFSHFAKSYSAHRYLRDEAAEGGRRPVGYIRPAHLLELTAVHLRVTFADAVAGPLVIGAGRHCGLGLMVGLDR